MPIEHSETRTLSEGDVEFAAVNFTGQLDSGETITAVSVVEVDSNHDAVSGGALTISSAAANVATLVIEGETVAIGKAAQWTVSGQLNDGGPNSDGTYRCKVTVTTSASRTKVRVYRFKAE